MEKNDFSPLSLECNLLTRTIKEKSSISIFKTRLNILLFNLANNFQSVICIRIKIYTVDYRNQSITVNKNLRDSTY